MTKEGCQWKYLLLRWLINISWQLFRGVLFLPSYWEQLLATVFNRFYVRGVDHYEVAKAQSYAGESKILACNQ
jgi:hypothetical protein